jgi:hypothetical protein
VSTSLDWRASCSPALAPVLRAKRTRALSSSRAEATSNAALFLRAESFFNVATTIKASPKGLAQRNGHAPRGASAVSPTALVPRCAYSRTGWSCSSHRTELESLRPKSSLLACRVLPVESHGALVAGFVRRPVDRRAISLFRSESVGPALRRRGRAPELVRSRASASSCAVRGVQSGWPDVDRRGVHDRRGLCRLRRRSPRVCSIGFLPARSVHRRPMLDRFAVYEWRRLQLRTRHPRVCWVELQCVYNGQLQDRFGLWSWWVLLAVGEQWNLLWHSGLLLPYVRRRVHRRRRLR